MPYEWSNVRCADLQNRQEYNNAIWGRRGLYKPRRYPYTSLPAPQNRSIKKGAKAPFNYEKNRSIKYSTSWQSFTTLSNNRPKIRIFSKASSRVERCVWHNKRFLRLCLFMFNSIFGVERDQSRCKLKLILQLYNKALTHCFQSFIKASYNYAKALIHNLNRIRIANELRIRYKSLARALQQTSISHVLVEVPKGS